MLSSFRIQNFKSIVDQTIELGKFNVFIGENGCGKSNILEAFAMAAAGLTGKLTNEELFARGIRAASPSLMVSAFRAQRIGPTISVGTTVNVNHRTIPLDVELEFRSGAGFAEVKTPVRRAMEKGFWDEMEKSEDWFDKVGRMHMAQEVGRLLESAVRKIAQSPSALASDLAQELQAQHRLTSLLADFGIYYPSTLALRGLQVESRREPLEHHST